MSFVKKMVVVTTLAAVGAVAGFSYWAKQPIASQQPVVFTVESGSGAVAVAQQIKAAGVPVNPLMLSTLARLTGRSANLKAGTYELKPGTTPRGLLDQMVRGEFAQEALTIIEGWTFRQMRQAVAASKGLKQDTAGLTDAELMAKVSSEYKSPEGLFFPDTYLFAKGASDLQVYRQAHATLLKKLNAAWEKRAEGLPYKSAYQALIMASIIEKETGKSSERPMIAAVFVNRLNKGMMLQTDPTVIYGIGAGFDGNIRKRDLETDTPYNTYTRAGLPPTPIALPGDESLAAAMGPAQTDALYFVSRGDGSSQFSGNLTDHNKAVNKFQR
ncbi:MAG: endolytic transglycosylase MltG [Telluria sp.]